MSLGLVGDQNIKGETRLAITTHEMAEVGVCLKHTLEPCEHYRPLDDAFDVKSDCNTDTLFVQLLLHSAMES